MSGQNITWIIFIILIFLVVECFFILLGIKLCKKNNGLGLFVLFIAINIFGLVLGISLLYNAKNGMYKEELEQDEKIKKSLLKINDSNSELKLKNQENTN